MNPVQNTLQQIGLDYGKELYGVPLNCEPWKPIDGINDPTSYKVKSAFKVFIETHPEPEVREALQLAFKEIQYVSFSSFLRALKIVVNQVNRAVGDKPFVMLVTPNESTHWIAELSLGYFVHKPRHVVNTKYFIEFIREHNEIRTAVIMDDASITANRIVRQLEHNILIGFRELKAEPFHVVIGFPYMTKDAESDIVKAYREEKVGMINFCRVKRLKSAPEQLKDPAKEAILSSMYMGEEKYRRIWFSLWVAGGLKRDIKAEYDGDFGFLLFQFGFKRTELLKLYTHKIKDELDEFFLDTIYSRPGLRLLADLIFSEFKLCVPRMRQLLIAQTYKLSTEDAHKIRELIHEFGYEKVDEGMRTRSLLVFDHRVPDSFSTLDSFGNGVIKRQTGKFVCDLRKKKIKARPFFSNDPGYATTN